MGLLASLKARGKPYNTAMALEVWRDNLIQEGQIVQVVDLSTPIPTRHDLSQNPPRDYRHPSYGVLSP